MLKFLESLHNVADLFVRWFGSLLALLVLFDGDHFVQMTWAIIVVGSLTVMVLIPPLRWVETMISAKYGVSEE